ncbi:MAG: hypothetical protein ACRD0O_17830 [Acidimicrobiia bacterium]
MSVSGEPPGRRERVTPMWMSHHDPADYGRCVLIGRNRVCRRCLVLYPVAFLVLALARAEIRWPTSLDAVLLVLLPLPAVAEFMAENLGALAYRPRRQVAVTVLLGAALGVGFDRYLDRQTDPLFWGVVVVYGGACFAALLVGARRRRQPRDHLP